MRIRTLVSATAMLALSAGAIASPQESYNFGTVPSASSVAGSGRTQVDASNVITVTSFAGSYSVKKLILAGTLTEVNTATLPSEAKIYVIPPVGPALIMTTPTVEGAFTNNVSIMGYPFAAANAGNWVFRFYESFQDSAVNVADSSWTNLSVTLDDGVADPAGTIDAGSLDPLAGGGAGNTYTSPSTALAAGGVQWFKFVLANPASAATRTYLDIDTEGSTLSGTNDTIMALYSGASAALVTGLTNNTDDNDGTTNLSQMSYGFTLGRPSPGGDALAYNGRDGTVPAGLYFLAVAGKGTTNTWGADYAAVSNSADSGNIIVKIKAATQPLVAPSSFYDFGTVDQTLPTPGSLTFAASTALTVPTNGVAWAKFVLPAPGIAAASRSWLDIDTETSVFAPANDTKVALYNGTTGVLVTSDDNDGSGTSPDLSQLSYGLTTGRPAFGSPAGAAYNGRDGSTLAANTYYIAVTGNGTTTFGADFGVTTTGGTNSSTAAVIRLRTGTTPVPYPGTFTDLGNITVVGAGSSVSSANIALAANGVAWFKFNLLTGVDKATLSYLDIDTEGSVLAAANDTRMGLYDNTGNYLSLSDDNDGSGLLSQLTFGREFRNFVGVAPNTSLVYNGRDGATRAAGTYWVAVTGQGTTTYGTTDYAVTSTSANTGTVKLNVRAGTYADAAPETTGGTVTDLGTLGTCGVSQFSLTLVPTEVKWYKFNLAANVEHVVTNNGTYLDLHTAGSALTTSNDTEIAVYNGNAGPNFGTLLAYNDDMGTYGGSGLLSMLSFGEGGANGGIDSLAPAGSNRPAIGTSGIFKGANGNLPAGTYYFCAGAFNTSQAAGFDVTSTSTNVGTMVVNIKFGNLSVTNTEPVSAPTLGTFDPASFGPGGGSATANATTTAFAVGDVKWYKIVLSSDATSAAHTYLDLDTEGSAVPATSMALYSQATTNPVASDNADGSGTKSQLSFGAGGLSARPAVGDGLAYNGRDGGLTAGTYYLAVTPFAGAFSTGWAATNCTTSPAGTITINAKAGYAPVVTPTPNYTFTAFSAPATCNVSTLSSPGEALAIGGVNWYKITVPAIDNAMGTYCDISTNGTTIDTNSWEPGFIDDTLMAIYNDQGTGLFLDDDTGQDNGSAFSFGATTPSRANGTNGAALVGQTAATLAAGDYYIAVIEYDDNAVFANDFGVSGGAGHVGGTTRLNVTVGKNAGGSATTTSGDPDSPPGTLSTLPLVGDNAWHASAPVPITGTGVVWLKFTAPDFSVARTYLDMDMEGSTVTNMALAVFTSAGAVEDNDTLDGTLNLPQLSYGFALGRPGPGGDALSYNGRDGTLTAFATYYLAIIAEPNDGNDTFAANWAITTPASCATPSGNAIFRYRTGVLPPPPPPVADADLGTISACGPTSVSTALMTINGANPMFRWVKFTTAAAISAPSFIDIHTIGSTIVSTGTFQDDTEIGLYDSTGASISNNDEFGGTHLSALSYGSTDGTGRTYAPFTSPCIGGTGASLAAGTYYIAIGQWNIDFNGDFAPVVTTGDEAGSVKINIVANVGAPCPTIGTDNANQTAACNGTATFTFVLNDPGAATYQWRKNGVALVDGALPNGAVISGANTATLTITGVRNSNASVGVNSTPGGYDCVVTTNNPCCAATINSAVGSLTVSPICACNYADISDQSGNGGGPDGQTTVSDLTFFLSEFFANSLTADISGQAGNGPPSDPPDGQVTVSDLVFFLAQFFSPCTNP